MNEVDKTPRLVGEAVQNIQVLANQAVLSPDERAFVNAQAAEISEQVMQKWAAARFRERKKVRPCCVGLAVGLAMSVAHRMAMPSEELMS